MEGGTGDVLQTGLSSSAGGVPGIKGSEKLGAEVLNTLSALPWCWQLFLLPGRGWERVVPKRFSWPNTVIPHPRLSQPYVFPVSYWVDNTEEKQDKSFPSLLYDKYNKWPAPSLEIVSNTVPSGFRAFWHKCIPSLYHIKTRREDKGNTFKASTTKCLIDIITMFL